MPRRRKFATLTQKEIRSFGYLILASPIIIVGIVALNLISSFANWLHRTIGLPDIFAFYFVIISSAILIVGIPISVIVIYNKQIEKKYRGINIANIDTKPFFVFLQILILLYIYVSQYFL